MFKSSLKKGRSLLIFVVTTFIRFGHLFYATTREDCTATVDLPGVSRRCINVEFLWLSTNGLNLVER